MATLPPQSVPESAAANPIDPDRSPPGPLWRFLTGAYLSSQGALAAHERQSHRVGLGHRIHTWLAMLTLVGICLPTFLTELSIIPLAAFSLLRAHRIWRCWIYAALSPVGLLMLVLVGWAWLSLLWTPDRTQGLDELWNTRWALLPGLLWPVLDQRRRLIGALVVGMLLGNLSQVSHAIGTHFQIDALRFPLAQDRNSGWWGAVRGGVMLTGALGLHLPAAFLGRRRVRALGIAGTVVTLLGILATGTRGAYLAAFGIIVVVVFVAMVRRLRSGERLTRRTIMPMGIGALLVVAGAIVLGPHLGPQMARRFDAARQDLSRAIEQKDFYTDTGGRLLMAWKGIEATRAHPLLGVGVGGYKAWCHADLKRQGIDPRTRNIHAHAHNAYIHIACTFGLPALLVAMTIIAAAVVGGLRGGLRSDGTHTPIDPGSYDAGPVCAILALCMVAMFDPIVTGSQASALLCALLGLCVMPRIKAGGAAWKQVEGAARPQGCPFT